MVATDGHRLAYVQTPCENAGVGQQFRALIPKKAMGELVKLGRGRSSGSESRVRGGDNHLFFKVGERLLITRKLTGNFPDYERVLPKDHTLIARLQKDEFAPPLSGWRSLRRSVRAPFACSLPRVK